MAILAELKRRKVFKVGVVYAAVGWAFVEVASTVIPTFEAPDWVLQVLTFLILLGFPIALVMAWALELTPEGIKLDDGGAGGQPAADDSAPTPAPRARRVDAPTQAGSASVAVLPFANLSHDGGNDYFSDGLSEELLSALARVPGLRVPGRTSTFQFKGWAGDIAEIRDQLNVGTILEGTVRTAGNFQVRITAQLTDTHDGYNIWSETYNRLLDDVFAVQDEIARAVTDALKITLLGEPQVQRPTANAEAYNAYLRGRFFWNQRTRDSYDKAIRYFEEATQIDPAFARAHAGLADAYCAVAMEGEADPDTWYRKARAASSRSLAIDPELVDAHICEGRIKLYHDRDWEGAEKEFRRALAINANDAAAQALHSRYLSLVGRLPEAVAAQEKAVALDPLSLVYNRLLGVTYYHAGRYPDAISALNRTIELDPDFQSTHYNLGAVEVALGRHEEALRQFDSETHEPLSLTGAAIAHALMGNEAEALSHRDRLIERHGEGWAYQVAQVCFQLGDADQGFMWLSRAREQNDPALLNMGVDPLLAGVRADPRYDALLQEIGLRTLLSPGNTPATT